MLVFKFFLTLTLIIYAKAASKGNYVGCYQKSDETNLKYDRTTLLECFDKCEKLFFK
jgi:hypothetical protein